MTLLVAQIRAAAPVPLFGFEDVPTSSEPAWVGFVRAWARGAEYLLPVGGEERAPLATDPQDGGRSRVRDGHVYIVAEGSVRCRVRIAALMLSSCDGWCLVLDTHELTPVRIPHDVPWFLGFRTPTWHPWPHNQARAGVMGDERAFLEWRSAGLSTELAGPARAMTAASRPSLQAQPSPPSAPAALQVAAPVAPGSAMAAAPSATDRSGPAPVGIFICSRGRRSAGKKCSSCSAPDALYLCDYETRPRAVGASPDDSTCSRAVCDRCKTSDGGRDLCPAHVAVVRGGVVQTAYGGAAAAPRPPGRGGKKTPPARDDTTLDLFGDPKR